MGTTVLKKEMSVQKLSLPIPAPEESNHVYPVSTLDKIKLLLETKVTHPALIIPARLTADLRKKLKEVLMNKPKLRDIYNLSPEDADSDQGIDPKTERKIALTNCHQSYADIYEHPKVKEILEDPGNATIRKSSHNVIIGYDHFAVDKVLAQILPKELSEIPSSFEVIGNLAHITLREEYYPYKLIIGRVILDKNKGISVVVNKIGTIQNEFRTFPMEILADDRKIVKENESGSLGLIVEVKEDGCRFQLDFEKVYWNSRLQFEHRRIVHLISGKARPTNIKKRSTNKVENLSSDEKVIVADACAGIGPFAVPLTSQYQNIEVYANDLNPTSYEYLKKNARLNRCGSKLHTYNMDGREFLRKMDEEGVKYNHVLMNLPAIAPEFLNVFSGWRGDYNHRPTIHVHCFASKINGKTEAVERCGRSLGCKLDMAIDKVSVHEVRNVSPKKNMYCVSFRLPQGVKDVERVEKFGLVAGKDDEKEEIEPPAKKSRTSNT